MPVKISGDGSYNMEILHKAKSIDTEEWIEGYIIFYPSGLCEIAQKKESRYDVLRLIPVDPETVCVYTGMKDKDGNRIWENDIFTEKHKGKVHYAFKVVFNNEYCTFELESNHGSAYNIQLVYKSKLKKEGNVFDNPELLERN